MWQLIIPVGIPGSGKSTYVRNNHADAIVVSSDEIRLDLFGSLEAAHAGDKDANNAQVFEEFHNVIEAHLRAGNDVVADATNLNADARLKLRNIAARVEGVRTNLIFFQNVKQAIKQNKQRHEDAVVPAEAMVYMLVKYIDSLDQIPRENYNVVVYITQLAIR